MRPAEESSAVCLRCVQAVDTHLRVYIMPRGDKTKLLTEAEGYEFLTKRFGVDRQGREGWTVLLNDPGVVYRCFNEIMSVKMEGRTQSPCRVLPTAPEQIECTTKSTTRPAAVKR